MNVTDNRNFSQHILPNQADLLDTAVDWIRDNLSPEDVFNREQLKQWASDDGYTKE
jgi:hypothetical protein